MAVCAAAALCLMLTLEAQNAALGHPSAKGRILLVLPFDNHTGQPSLEWVREAAPEILGARFASAGFAPMSRADRHYAYDHLGLPKIFQPFFTTRRSSGGSGLGLHIVYNIVRQRLGGSILVSSVPGEGTTFQIDMPSVAPATTKEGVQ